MSKEIESKVSNPRLFKAVYSAVVDAVEHNNVPNQTLKGGLTIYRASDKKYVLENQKLTKKTLESCLEVRDGSSSDSNANRFTGAAPDGSAHVGGVYFATHVTPMLMEVRHYNNKRNVKQALRGKVVLEVEVLGAINVMDLSMHSPETTKFLTAIGKSSEVRAVLNGRVPELKQKMLSNDFSVSRAIGLAAGSMGYDGLIAQTARTDLDSKTGDNLILFGRNGKRVSRKLRIVSAMLFKLRKGPNELAVQKFIVQGHNVVPI